MNSLALLEFTDNSKPFLQNSHANLQATRTQAIVQSQHVEGLKVCSGLSSYQEEFQVNNLAREGYTQVNRAYFSPVFLSGKTLMGYDHHSKKWCKIFTSDCFAPMSELISPRITFDGPLMLLVWKSLSSDGLLFSTGLVADLRTGEYENVEFPVEDSLSEDPAVDPYAIRLVQEGIHKIVTLYATFLENSIRIAIHGARFDGAAPCWETKAWYVKSHFYSSSFLARCNAYVDGNLLCLCRSSETGGTSSYILWKLNLEMGTFDNMLIEVPHEWSFADSDEHESWSTLLDSGLPIEVEPLECSVLLCASKIMLVFLFRVGPPPSDDRDTYYATTRVHEIVDFTNSADINYPPFVSMSPLMCMHTNEECEYMSTTFVSDKEFIYICPNYSSMQRDGVSTFEVSRREWSLLPAASSLDLAEWKCWGETQCDYYPSTV